jgi:hypothetical protein
MVNIRDSISDLIRLFYMKQTYFRKSGMSRNRYAGLCGAEIIFDDQSDFIRSIAMQSITFGDQSCGFIGTINRYAIDSKN